MAVRHTKIYGDQLDVSAVGLGLTKNVTDDFSHKLDVDVDASTIEVSGSNKVQVKDLGITTGKIANDAVDKTKINSDVAGNGIVQNVDGSLELNPDNATLEIVSGEVLQVKDNGITEAKLNMYNSPSVGNVLKYTANGMEWSSDSGLISSNFVFHEIPSGLINSLNTTYTLANTPVAGTVQVFLNGLLQAPGVGLDYTISGTTITFVKAPRTNSDLYVHYIK